MPHEFDFIDDESGGRFVPLGGPIAELRQLLARGDVDAAVKLFEETGGAAREALIAEASTASFETKRAIAQLLKRARDFASAAQVFVNARLDGEAASCFEHALDFGKAAACWAKIGEELKAAAAFERAGQIDQAVAHYKQAGANDRLAECLARSHQYVEAARAFRALKKTHAEVEALTAGLTAEPGQLELAARLGELMLQHGKQAQAVQVLTDAAKRNPKAKDDARLLTLLAMALEATGNREGAAKVRARLKELPQTEPPIVEAVAVEGPKATPGADAYGFLKALPMFADLALPDMKALYRVCAMQAYEAGQHLIEPGQPGRGLFVIVEGQVEVYAGMDPSARLLNTLGVGKYVGEISLVQDGPTSARVTARTPVKVLFISRDAFHQYVYGAPMAALRIYQLFTFNLAERVRALSAAK